MAYISDVYKDNMFETWYDSSNVVYSRCYDTDGDTVNVKIVFKGGRTYMYRNVDKNHYNIFRTSDSNGKAFNDFIKEYKGVRISDTDMNLLEERRKMMDKKRTELSESKVSDMKYHIVACDKDGKFSLFVNGERVFSGTEGEVSVLNLMKALGLNYTMEMVEELNVESDENLEEIRL